MYTPRCCRVRRPHSRATGMVIFSASHIWPAYTREAVHRHRMYAFKSLYSSSFRFSVSVPLSFSLYPFLSLSLFAVRNLPFIIISHNHLFQAVVSISIWPTHNEHIRERNRKWMASLKLPNLLICMPKQHNGMFGCICVCLFVCLCSRLHQHRNRYVVNIVSCISETVIHLFMCYTHFDSRDYMGWRTYSMAR